ncbi:MAG TPA: response regulator, partial [Armatimonadota bacterium]|nr:response regulator [Armatimonadota bacterium]
MRIHTRLWLAAALLMLFFIAALVIVQARIASTMALMSRVREREMDQTLGRVVELSGSPPATFTADRCRSVEVASLVRSRSAQRVAELLRPSLSLYGVDGVWVYDASCVPIAVCVGPSSAVPGDPPFGRDALRELCEGAQAGHFYMALESTVLELWYGAIQPSAAGGDRDEQTPVGWLLAGRILSDDVLQSVADVLGGEVYLLRARPPRGTPPAPLDEPAGAGPSQLGPGPKGRTSLAESVRELAVDEAPPPPDKAGSPPPPPMESLSPGRTAPGPPTLTSIMALCRLHDHKGRPVAVLEARVPSPATRLLRDGARASILLGSGLALGLLGAVTYILIAWMANPLRRVSRALETAQRDPIAPLMGQGHEFGKVADLIDAFFRQRHELIEALEQQRAVSEALRATEERHELAMAATSASVWEWDLVTGRMHVGARLYTMLGLEPGELDVPFGAFHSRMHPDDLPSVQATIRDHLGPGAGGFTTEYRLATAWGGWVWIMSRGDVVARDDDGRPIRFVGTHVDITERREMELALRESEERLRTIAAAAQDAVIMMDHEGRITYWNPAAERIFGWLEHEALGRELHTLVAPPETHEAYRAGLRQFQASGTGPALGRLLQLEARVREGRTIPVEVSISSVRMGGQWCAVGIVRDITERVEAQRRLESALRTAQEMAVAAEAASAAKSEFLANMSHEIRTPMNAVIGMTELVLDAELTAEQREYLETVRSSGEALLDIINDVLDFSKLEAGRLSIEHTNFGLRSAVEAAVSSLAVRAHEKGLELVCRIAHDVPELLIGDPGRLRQVVVNLIGNAIKFTPQGEVEFRVEVASEDDDEVELCFSVSDTGIGIAADKLERIFESFTQADGSTTRQYGGTGLGLAICRRIVELMGGHIWAESEEGKGSVFRFRARFGVRERAAVTPADASLEGARVLVVDDSATNRAMLRECLTAWGVEVLELSTGDEAVAFLEGEVASGRGCQAVLMDRAMPGADGFEVARRIAAHPLLSHVPVMMLTSAGRRGDVARCREMGVAGYLMKPVRQSELRQALRMALARGTCLEAATEPITRHTVRQARRQLRVLLAEDHPVNQKLATRLLERAGHVVTVVADGQEALDVFEPGRFDVILMDVQMPRMDGVQATMAIRLKEHQHPNAAHVPIIALTAHALATDRTRFIAAGMDDHVAKPVTADTLLGTVERLTRPS